jgi:hypothetical protein
MCYNNQTQSALHYNSTEGDMACYADEASLEKNDFDMLRNKAFYKQISMPVKKVASQQDQEQMLRCEEEVLCAT